MISAEDMAARQTSFWSVTAPMLEGLVRTVNTHPRRFGRPVRTDRWSHRRAFIAETAFAQFRARHDHPSQQRPTIEREARDRVALLIGRDSASLGDLTFVERQQADLLADRMYLFFRRRARGRPVQIDPPFRGCGVVSASEGDVLLGDVLFEVKAVARSFRALDIRQLLVYAALDFASTTPRVRRLGLYNPLQGVWEEWASNDLSLSIAGLPSNELFHRIVAYFTSDLEMERDEWQ